MPPALPSLASRVTLPWTDLSGWVAAATQYCSAIVVYQHTGSKTEKVHCHILWWEPTVIADTLKNIAKRDFGLTLKGNGDWSFKTKYKDRLGTSLKVNKDVITYMSKGVLEPSYIFGVTLEECTTFKSKWVQHTDARNDINVLYDSWAEDLEFAFYKQWGKDYDLPFEGPVKTISHTDHRGNVEVLLDASNYIRTSAYQTALSLTGYIHTPRTSQLANSLHITYRHRHNLLSSQDLAKILKC